MKQILLFASLGMLAVVGCQSELPSAPINATSYSRTSLEGTWDYVSTDGQDLSDYGITYSFHGNEWTYTLGDAGSKTYRFTNDGDKLEATLVNDGMHSNDKLGSEITSLMQIKGDTLIMQSDGHTAILTRQ